jgi:hypothetical protein
MNYNWLTPRDREVYEYLSKNTKYVSTSQLTELFFKVNSKGQILRNGKQICRRRMAALEKNITEIQSFYRQANADKVYTILPPKEHIAPLSKIEHSLSLNELYIQIRKHAAKHGHTIHDFKVETTIKDGIVPDVILTYIINKRARIFFLEYDRSTEPLTRIKKKLERYESYMTRQLYQNEDWQTFDTVVRPQVVFVTESTSRAAKIQKLGAAAYTDVTQILMF